MKKHNDFDIWLHDDDELSIIRGANIVSRQTVQEWPLSVVERTTFTDGASRIYKAFNNLPVETEFYRNVQSPHIPEVYYSHSNGDRHWLLLENISGQHPDNLNQEKLRGLAGRAKEIIRGINSVVPYRYNLSENYYGGFLTVTIELLRKLHQEKKFIKTDGDAINRIEEAMSHSEVLHTIRGRCALLHGDLKLNNILIRPDGEMVIIDWQNILFGPEDIDVCHMMAAQNIDPVPITGIGPEILRLALIIKWFADCADRWIPYLADFYDGQIVEMEKNMSNVLKHK